MTTLQRTAQTAAPLAARLGIEPRVEADLREVYLGEWEGGSFRRNFAEGHPTAARMFAEGRWDAIPGGEPARRLRRPGARRRSIASPPPTPTSGGGRRPRRHDRPHPGRGVGTPNGFTFVGSDNASISHIVVTPDRWIIRRYNDTSHLGLAFTTSPEPPT